MRSGLFDHWQGEYAERGVITFPVTRDKTPAVRGYMKAGRRASAQFALKFPDALGIGFACKRNRITVLDVDTKDERVLADGLSRHGHTPIIVRTGSGHFQAWYRHNGEARRIRPEPKVPIDILGDGFVVAPPTQANTGEYRIIEGSLDDLSSLPTMRQLETGVKVQEKQRAKDAIAMQSQCERNALKKGDGRNDALFNRCLEIVTGCGRLEELMEKAMKYNMEAFHEPMSADEVLKVVASAWGYEVRGENWKGRGARVVFAADDVDDLMSTSQDAFLLLSMIRRHNWGREFHVANGMAETMKWRRQRLAAARAHLIQSGYIEEVEPPTRHQPAVYRFRVSRNAHQ